MHGTLAARLVRLATDIKREHQLHLQKSRESAAHAILAGELLIQAKNALDTHGAWGPWLRQNVGFSERTARVYMQLAKRVAELSPAKRQRAADLSQRKALEQIGRKSESHDNHYTPVEWVEPVRRTYGGTIDLDPCSDAQANATVRATSYYTEDGLDRPWPGNVFANILYSEADEWVQKALEEYRAGHAAAVILLVPGWRCTSWFKPLWDFPLCFTHERIRFYGGGNPSNGSIFAYLGSDPDAFYREFKQLGAVMTRFRSAS